MTKINLKSLAFYLLVPIMVYFIISMLVFDVSPYYNSLVKPIPELPYIVFPIVWSFMYLLMGVAAYLVDTSEAEEDKKKKALNAFLWQFLISLFGLPIIFGLRWLLVGFFWALLLLTLIFITMKKFAKINPVSGYLMFVYLMWVAFVAYYVLGIYILS